MHSLKIVIIPAVVMLLLLAGPSVGRAQEDEEGEGGSMTAAVATSACLSGMRWTGGNEGSPLMRPGGNCIACHASGEGLQFAVSGTVYAGAAEADDCFGVSGATVRLTDSKGKVLSVETNKAGNFFVGARGPVLAMPFTAKVIFKGSERRMFAPKSSGNCMSCHTSKGANGAPGRIMVPD